jgi:hypothetical protein
VCVCALAEFGVIVVFFLCRSRAERVGAGPHQGPAAAAAGTTKSCGAASGGAGHGHDCCRRRRAEEGKAAQKQRRGNRRCRALAARARAVGTGTQRRPCRQHDASEGHPRQGPTQTQLAGGGRRR